MARAYNIDDIMAFLAKETLAKKIRPQSDLFRNLGVDGDDFEDLMDAYSKSFSVDMTCYLWYFHHQEEPLNFGKLFWKSPNQRVRRIPVTPTMLLDFAHKGTWALEYPAHRLPAKRYDILIHGIVAILLLLLVIVLPFLC